MDERARGATDGFVSVGVDHDTPVFAVNSIEAWWKQVGAKRYPEAREISAEIWSPAHCRGRVSQDTSSRSEASHAIGRGPFRATHPFAVRTKVT